MYDSDVMSPLIFVNTMNKNTQNVKSTISSPTII